MAILSQLQLFRPLSPSSSEYSLHNSSTTPAYSQMGSAINVTFSWSISPISGNREFIRGRCNVLTNFLAKNSSSNKYHVSLLGCKNPDSNPCRGMEVVSCTNTDCGNIHIDCGDTHTDWSFSHSTAEDHTGSSNLQWSTSGNTHTESNSSECSRRRASDTSQTEWNSGAPPECFGDIKNSVGQDDENTLQVAASISMDNGGKQSNIHALEMMAEEERFSGNGKEKAGEDYRLQNDCLEGISVTKTATEESCTMAATTALSSDNISISKMHIRGAGEYISNNPMGGECQSDGGESGRTNDELEKLPREKVRRFTLETPDFLKTLQEGKTFSPMELELMKLLMKFKFTNGTLVVRALRVEQLRDIEELLTDSYSELMWGPLTYRPVLAWILRRYLRERQAFLPHAVTLVGLYAPPEENVVVGGNVDSTSCNWLLVGAVEVSFNASGQPNDLQTPVPPKDAPFLSNMAVQKKFRRRGIGWQLLKAAEELAIQMGCKEMYLHCRMIDNAPLSMYKKSGYKIVATDSILSLLTFQRRRYLMCKRLSKSS